MNELNAHPTTLFGFDILDVLGCGAGSFIYLAVEKQTGQLRALKRVSRSEDCQTRLLEQVRTEYQVSKDFTHSGLRRCLELKEQKRLMGGTVDAVLVMEMFDGVTLESAGPVPLPRLVRHFIQVAEALQALHAMGFVHCDLKPNNILVNDEGQTKVIDFGQSCRIGTVKERIQGTPDFMAPEQAARKTVTPQTDVFCLGAALYALMTGRKVPTVFTAGRKSNSFVLHDGIAEPAALNPLVPTCLSHLVMDCIHTSPSRRPADMKTVAWRLELAGHKLGQSAPAPIVSAMPG